MQVPSSGIITVNGTHFGEIKHDANLEGFPLSRALFGLTMTPDLALLPSVAPKPRLVRGFTTEQRWLRRRSVKSLMESDLQAVGRSE